MRKLSMVLDREGIAEETHGSLGQAIRKVRRTRRVLVASLLTVGAILAVLAVVLAPATQTGAFPGRTGGNCGNCHPASSVNFLTVTGFPAEYVPNQEYTISITIEDTNGLSVGENSFDLILASGSGSVVGVDSKVKNVSALEVATNQAVNTTTNQWTVKWTAPASGAVTVDTWAVWGNGSGINSGYKQTTINATVIPEFTLLLLPIAGIAATMVLLSRISKRRRST